MNKSVIVVFHKDNGVPFSVISSMLGLNLKEVSELYVKGKKAERHFLTRESRKVVYRKRLFNKKE